MVRQASALPVAHRVGAEVEVGVVEAALGDPEQGNLVLGNVAFVVYTTLVNLLPLISVWPVLHHSFFVPLPLVLVGEAETTVH